MQRTKPPFRADEVGSLLRPTSLLDARDAYRNGRLEAAELKRQQDAAILEALERQQQCCCKGDNHNRRITSRPAPDSDHALLVDHAIGGKHKLGAISKMGERTIRRLLILGASAVVRWASQRGAVAGSWLARMLARKPRMLVTTALANKMARIVWALLVKGGIYRVPVAAV